MIRSILKATHKVAVALALSLVSATVATAAGVLPAPAVDTPLASAKRTETAVLAGGCFWGVEAVFEHLKGVTNVISGYSGDGAGNAKYDVVSSGRTRHAEAVRITYDPSQITYGQLLKVFFAVAHDPTTLNYQGPDHGYQYRSAIFYGNEEQKRVAEAYVKQLTEAKSFSKPIVTKISALPAFYPAEDYHKDFVRLNPSHPYVMVNARTKLKKLRDHFPELLKNKS